MDNLELMKQEISNLAKEKKEEFEKVSDYIFANPELAFKEYKSQEALCKLLGKPWLCCQTRNCRNADVF